MYSLISKEVLKSSTKAEKLFSVFHYFFLNKKSGHSIHTH